MKTQFLLLALLLTIITYQAHGMDYSLTIGEKEYDRVLKLYQAYQDNKPIADTELNQCVTKNQTPFFEALYQKPKDLAFIEYLIKCGANVNKLSGGGLPILYPLSGGNPELTALLLKHNAQFTMPEISQHEAILYTIHKLEDRLGALIQLGRPHEKDETIQSYSQCIELLINAGCPLSDLEKPDLPSALHQVLEFPTITKLLLLNGADLEIKYAGKTPLEKAASYINYYQEPAYKQSYELVKEAQELKDLR